MVDNGDVSVLRHRTQATSPGTPRWQGEETKGKDASQQLVSLGPLHASITVLRLLLPVVAILSTILSSDTKHGHREFWHCLPFACAGITAALIRAAFKTFGQGWTRDELELMSWQFNQFAVPAAQLLALAIGVLHWDFEYDMDMHTLHHRWESMGVGCVAAVVHLLWPYVCSSAGVIDKDFGMCPSPRLMPYPVGFPSPGNHCRSSAQVVSIGLRIFSNIFVLPVVDEIFFRSFLDDRLSEYLGWTIGCIATAIVWGSLHGGYPFEWLYAAAFGLVLQLLVEHPTSETEIITAAIVAHCARNTCLSVYAVVTKHWHLLEL